MLKYEDAKVLIEEMDEIPDIKPQDIQSALKVMKMLQLMKKQKGSNNKEEFFSSNAKK